MTSNPSFALLSFAFLIKEGSLFFLFCQTVTLNCKHLPLPFHPSNIPTHSLLALSNSWPLLLLIATMCIHVYIYIHTYISLNTTCWVYYNTTHMYVFTAGHLYGSQLSILSWRRLPLSIPWSPVALWLNEASWTFLPCTLHVYCCCPCSAHV